MTDVLNNEVRLRGVVVDDLPVFFVHQLEPDAAQMAAFPSRQRDAFMAHWNKIMADQSNILKTVLVDGGIAGNVVSFEMDGKREVGYWIGKEFWGKGIATRALAEFLRQEKVRPLYAHVAKHNIASLRVLEKCGFSISGEDVSDALGRVVEEYILTLV